MARCEINISDISANIQINMTKWVLNSLNLNSSTNRHLKWSCSSVLFIPRFLLAVHVKYWSSICIVARVQHCSVFRLFSKIYFIGWKWHFTKLRTLPLERITFDTLVNDRSPTRRPIQLSHVVDASLLHVTKHSMRVNCIWYSPYKGFLGHVSLFIYNASFSTS